MNVQKELIDALKAKDTMKILVFRDLKGRLEFKLQSEERALDANGVRLPITEDEIQETLQEMFKDRSKSIKIMTEGNRPDLVAKEQAEIEEIKKYLPKKMDADAVRVALNEIIQSCKSDTKPLFKDVIQVFKQLHVDEDMRLVSTILKEILV